MEAVEAKSWGTACGNCARAATGHVDAGFQLWLFGGEVEVAVNH